jgi:hypothetical protein
MGKSNLVTGMTLVSLVEELKATVALVPIMELEHL